MKKLKRRDIAAFEQCYSQYSAALFGYIQSTLFNKQVSEEILRQVFIDIFNSIDEYDPEKIQLFTWMYQKARTKTRIAKIDLVIKDIFLCQDKNYVPTGNIILH